MARSSFMAHRFSVVLPQLDSPDPTRKDPRMARKTIRVSDQSGDEIAEGKGATVRITFADARKGVRELDLTDAEAERLGGRAVARRGRKPKS
jgi:hypothetical protein